MTLSTRQAEVLKAMKTGVRHKVRELGAIKNSHHCDTLQQLARKGLVDKIEVHAGVARRTYLYAITELGRRALKSNLKE